MTTTGITPELLSAYVDGELSATEAAEVARALADDRALATQVARLSRLKAVLPQAVDAIDVQMPKAQRARPVRRAALAASFVAALLAGGVLLFGPWTAPSQPAALAQAWRLHESWASATNAETDSVALLTVRAALGAQAMPPDLRSARLTLERVVLLEDESGAPVLHAGYSGTRGCRVSYFVLGSAAALPEAFTAFGAGTARAYGWRVGGRGFLLLAEGMDPDRFALIAESVYAASLEQAPLDEETRTALARSRSESAPCRA